MAGLYQDDGISGASLRRLYGLLSALEAIESGSISALAIIDIDRITRFSAEAEKSLVLDTIRRANCLLLTPDRIYDLSHRADRLHVGLHGLISRYDLESIRDRCRRGQEEARAALTALIESIFCRRNNAYVTFRFPVLADGSKTKRLKLQ